MSYRTYLAAGMLALALPESAAAQINIVPDTRRTVSVTGKGEVVASPDTATAEVGVSVVDPDAKKAKTAVDGIIAKIVALAKSLGVPETELTTASVNIEPRYDEDNAVRLRGFEVTQSVTAVFRDLAKLDRFLDGAVQAGANRNFDVTVTSSREADLKQQALKLALDAAKRQAELAATQLGVRLGAVGSINLNPASGYTNVASARIVSDGGAKFLPGVIRISSDVTVSFLIEDLK